MIKTKKQLRAEAVERLKNCVAARFDAESIVIALASGRHGQSDWSLECDKLIYLLTYDELPEGDAPSEFAEILMALAADCSCMGDGIVRHFEPKDVQGYVDDLMRVVERDYVRREAYEDLRDEFVWTNAFLHRIGKKCGTKDVPSLKAYVEQLEAKVDAAAEADAGDGGQPARIEITD